MLRAKAVKKNTAYGSFVTFRGNTEKCIGNSVSQLLNIY